MAYEKQGFYDRQVLDFDDLVLMEEGIIDAQEAAKKAQDLAANFQLYPEFANSIEECIDTSKLYVLPDGYIYAYVSQTFTGGAQFTNLVPTSTDTDGSVYNGTGYKENVRLSSSGGVSSETLTGSVTTGFIPCTVNDVIRMKGATWLDNANPHLYYLHFYTSDKTFITESLSANNYDGAYANGVSITYDEEAGVTTFDVTDGSDFAGRLTDAAYFRLNAYGKGADLILTVNEEIAYSEDSTEYAWANTGHAFVPADYESRIIVLEEGAEENAAAVAELEQQVADILDGTTEIAANTKFDPTVYGLPVLYLSGDISPIAASKDNKVTIDYAYGDLSGTCTLKGQGATSYKIAQSLGEYGKYNYTINFDQKFEAVEGWGSQKKYCLKANWIDHTHSRNVVSAKLWGMIVKSRATVPTELADLPNGGAVDGFPIVIMLNDEFHGLYTFNIPKDGWMFNLKEDASMTQAVLGANDHELATQFKGELAGDESDFELEFVSDEDNADWVTASLNTLINACINSDGTDLDTTVAQYLDWDSVIDYMIFITVIKGTDMVDKNYLLTTFDGTKWYFTAYDIDSTYGLNWDGSGLTRAVSNVTFVECANTHRAYELVKKHKASELKARYAELRANVLSETRIVQTFENFAWAIPSPVALEDVKKYPSILGSNVNGIDQIARWVRQRLEAVDAWADAL